MKNIILVCSIIMIVGLIFCTYYYQNQEQITLPQLNQPNNLKPPQPKRLQPVNNDTISYTLQNNELNITYNRGESWVKVPIEKDLLFEGEYRGNKQELIDGSFILTENRAAFLYSEGLNGESKRIVLKYSLDQGKTWQDSVVMESFPSIRFRKVDFLNEQFGYVIISGDRTMSQEYSLALLTHDGGKTWKKTADSGITRLISDGGFIDEKTGFLSFGTINPQEPSFYVTEDGGKSWRQSLINIPGKYDRIFVQAEIPVKENGHLSLLVNQGPNGDYQGGRVKGKFISKDNGKTWEFSQEVQ